MSILRTFLSWIFILASLLIVGPSLAALTSVLTDVFGTQHTSLLLGASTWWGLAIGLAVVGVALAVAAAGARFFTFGIAFACTGFVLAWASWGLGTVEQIIRLRSGASTLAILSAETLLLSFAAAAISIVILRVTQQAQPMPLPAGRSLLLLAADADNGQTPPLKAVLLPFVAALLVAAALAMLVAANGLKGQTLFAAIIAAIGAGFAAAHFALMAKSMVTPLVPVMAVCIAGSLSSLVARFYHGDGLVEALFAGKLLPIARMLPLDWIAGACLGVPLGMSWRGVLLDSRSVELSDNPLQAVVWTKP